MHIKDYLDKNSKFCIYGTGINAKRLYMLLEKNGVTPLFFVVSDGMDTSDICGVHVYHISEKSESISNQRITTLVAVSNKYIADIEATLKARLISFYHLQEEDYCFLQRRAYPINETLFLRQENPISRMFGFDRGKPIDRYYIEEFLRDQSEALNSVEDLLEVGDDTYSKRYFSNAQNSDILSFEKGQDLTDLSTLPAQRYDVFIATQVFNFIYDVRSAIRGAALLLKNGGVLLATVGGVIAPVSLYDFERWGDYWRFTEMSIKRLMEDAFDEVETYPFGNAAIATAFVQGLSVEDIQEENILDYYDSKYSICIGIVARKRGK